MILLWLLIVLWCWMIFLGVLLILLRLFLDWWVVWCRLIMLMVRVMMCGRCFLRSWFV